jgi:hypothetical protein
MDGVIDLSNSWFSNIIGIAEDRVVGTDFLALCQPDIAAEIRRELRQKRGSTARTLSGNLITALGAATAVRLWVLPIFDAQGFRSGLAIAMTKLDPGVQFPSSVFSNVVEEIAGVLGIGLYVIDAHFKVISANDMGLFFVRGVQALKDFFARHKKAGREIRYVIKTGIGGQHTPFQGIADGFAAASPALRAPSPLGEGRGEARIVGEYELGKDFEAAIGADLKALGTGWDRVAIIPSSKSGSTDETMIIFGHLLRILLKQALSARGPEIADRLAISVLDYFHDLNASRDKQGSELFKGFSFDELA